MKKTLLLAGMMATTVAATAQVTWFSQTVGATHAVSTVHSGYGAVRMADGTFLGAALADGGGIQVKKFAADGALVSTHNNLAATHQWTMINTVELLDDGAALLVSGMGTDPSMMTSAFLVARVDLSTMAVNMVTQNVGFFTYTSGPDVSVTDDAVFVIYPDFNKIQAARFTHGLTQEWNRCIVPDSGDTLGGKFPSMGGSRCDSGIVITCKDDSSYGHSRMSEGGSLLSYTVYRGPGYIRAYNVSPASDGNVIVSGLYSPYYASGPDSRPLVGKFTPDGDVIWVKVLDKFAAMPSLRRFVNAMETPDGRIVAFGSLEEAYNDTYFDGVCTFDANGNLLSAKRVGDGSNLYYLYDAKFYGDGMLLTGNVNFENVMIFTNYSLDQVCQTYDLFMSVDNHDLGPKVTSAPGDMYVWNANSTPATMAALSSSMDAQPVTCSKVTGVADPNAAATVVYPNPASLGTEVMVDFATAGEYTLSLIDVTGKTLSVRTVSGTHATVGTQGLAPGVYMVTVKGANGTSSSEKLVIQ